MRKDIDDSFDRALEMISMVEELLQKDLNKELSDKANQGLSATLKIARNMLKSDDLIKSQKEEMSLDEKEELENSSLAYDANSSKNKGKHSKQRRRTPVIHMTRKALNLG